MRDFLTGLAVAVILLLTAASAAPHFIDWSAHRDAAERELAHALGRPVRIAGEIGVRLLPSPVLKLGDVTVGGGRPDDPVLAADSVSLEIATASLLRGEIRIVDAVLDGARLDLTLDERGRVAGFAGAGHAVDAPIAVERFIIRRSTLFIHDAPGTAGRLMTGIDVEARAPSLAGPWRVTGRGTVGGRIHEVRFSTGERETDGAFRARFALFEENGRRIEFDGRVTAEGVEGQGRWSGRLSLPGPQGPAERVATASAALRTQGRRVLLEAVDLDTGEETGLKFAGKGVFDPSATGGLSLDLDARTLDLDRSAAEGGPRSAERILADWVEAAGRTVEASAVPVRIGASLGTVIAGGDAIRDVFVQLRTEGRAIRIEGLKAALPGRTVVTASGDAGFERGARFAGSAALASEDAARLAGWWTGEPSGRSTRITGRLEARGDLSAAPGVVGARIDRLALDRSAVAGVIRYVPGESGSPARIQAQLSSERIVLDELPDLSGIAAGLPGTHVTVAIEARNVGLARAGVGAGRVLAKFSADASGIDVETIEMLDVAGATLRAGGRLGPSGGRLTAELDSRRPAAFAALLERILPGRATSAFLDRAPDLGPLRLSFTAERGGADAPVLFSVRGGAGGTTILGEGEWPAARGARPASRWEARSADTAQFLRQAGLETLPIPLGGEAVLTVATQASDGAATARLTLPGGTITGEWNAGSGSVAGRLSADGVDWGPVFRIVGVPVPDVTARVPGRLVARLAEKDDRILFEGIEADLSGRRFTGDLAWDAARGRAEGRLAADALDLGTLVALSLGPPPAGRPDAPRSSGRFTPAPAPRFDAAVVLELARLDLFAGHAVEGARVAVDWSGEKLELRLERSRLGAGTATGTLALRRDGGRIGAIGRIGLAGVAVESLLGTAQPLRGTADFDLDGGSSGESPAGLAAAASGAGRLVLRGAELLRTDPAAPNRVALESEAAGITDPRRIRVAVLKALDARAFAPSAPVEIPVAASGGLLKFGGFNAAVNDAALQGSASYDLKTSRFEAKMILVAAAPPKGWPAPAPEIATVLRGGSEGALQREADVSMLANLLTTRAVQRELERIEAMELEMRERAAALQRAQLEREKAEAGRRAEEEAARNEARRILGVGEPSQPDAAPALSR